MHTVYTVVNLRRCKTIIFTPVSALLSFTRETRIRNAETPLRPQASVIISFFLGCTLDLPTSISKHAPHDLAQAKSRLWQAHVHRPQKRKDHRTPPQVALHANDKETPMPPWQVATSTCLNTELLQAVNRKQEMVTNPNFFNG